MSFTQGAARIGGGSAAVTGASISLQRQVVVRFADHLPPEQPNIRHRLYLVDIKFESIDHRQRKPVNGLSAARISLQSWLTNS